MATVTEVINSQVIVYNDKECGTKAPQSFSFDINFCYLPLTIPCIYLQWLFDELLVNYSSSIVFL